MRYTVEKITFSSETARELASELAKSKALTARAQTYIGKLQSQKERELVYQILVILGREKIGINFWHRLQTAAFIRQKCAHFRADVLAEVDKERKEAQAELKKKRTVPELLRLHKDEILKLCKEGRTSKEIAKYLHRAHRSQFSAKGSPHYKTVQAAIREFRS